MKGFHKERQDGFDDGGMRGLDVVPCYERRIFFYILTVNSDGFVFLIEA